MARFRLLVAHQLVHKKDGPTMLLGDKENYFLGPERGEVVGDGTDYPVTHPTIHMEPLDEEAVTMIAAERERVESNESDPDPVEALPLTMKALVSAVQAASIPEPQSKEKSPRS